MTLHDEIKSKSGICNGREVLFPFDAESIARKHIIAFGAWYSGMSPQKVEAAFNRYEEERQQQLMDSLPVFVHTTSGESPTEEQLKELVKLVDETLPPKRRETELEILMNECDVRLNDLTIQIKTNEELARQLDRQAMVDLIDLYSCRSEVMKIKMRIQQLILGLL